jgi:NodT family efflux transporter outer membrane factor (OMF) lipoprotein
MSFTSRIDAKRWAGSVSVLILLSGCSTLGRTTYERPSLTVPAQWASVSAAPDAHASITSDDPAPVAAWWRDFNDEALNQLVDLALERNNDLFSADLRVRRAQLQAALASNALNPNPNASVQGSWSRSLEESGTSRRGQSANLSVSYELDIWNRLGSKLDAAQLEAEASVFDLQAVRLAVAGSVVERYWQAGFLNQRVATMLASIERAERTLDIVQARRSEGAVSGLELKEAQQSLQTLESALLSLRQQQYENRNALAILFNQPPQQQMAEPPSLPDANLPDIVAGLPAQLLARRPDVAASEARLRASLATTDSTRASFYPTISLTGSIGTSSEALFRFLQNPIASLGAGIVLPFLKWQDMKASIRISETDYEIAVTDFRQSLYAAMTEVENALSARHSYIEQAAILRRSLQLASEAEAIYEIRYREGAVALNVWLDAQEKRRSAELALSENMLNRLLAQAGAHRALGG